jgi:hypothetical protein
MDAIAWRCFSSFENTATQQTGGAEQAAGRRVDVPAHPVEANRWMAVRLAMRTNGLRLAALVLAVALVCGIAGCSDDSGNGRTDGGTDGANDGHLNDAGPDAEIDGAFDGTVDGAVDGEVVANCLEAEGPGATGTNTWVDDIGQAEVSISGAVCDRTFTLSTTATLRDNLPANPRVFDEVAGWPAVSTRNDMFDALYALALEEVRQCSVASIQDGAYNNAQPIQCPSGGCFETGRLWTFAWTRDTAYAVDLGLAALDPTRARNTLEFKLSELRSGGRLQFVQDTGSGGSYPVSSDRAVWALGAWQVLKFLSGAERDAFLALAFEAAQNTIDHDRAVIFDATLGLYRGEQSFLDWREQSYPSWTASDTVQIHMSKALSTNVAHLRLLEIAAQMADELGESALATTYQGWANDLRSAINSTFYLPASGMYATFITTFLDPAPAHQFDLLGSALAVLAEVGPSARLENVVSGYPHLPKGPPVIWPQQKEIPIYHNRGLWPFVTAYMIRAARKVRNDAVVNHDVRSLIRGAALNLSNMENFEMVSGLPWVDDGPYSGPVVNSQRQLWSVAGYVSMVHDIIFGIEPSQTGLRFRPFITRDLRNSLFSGADNLVLNHFPYHGHTLTVVVELPPTSAVDDSSYTVEEVRFNGTVLNSELTPAMLEAENQITVTLIDTPEPGASMTLVTDTAEYRNLFAPLVPTINDVTLTGGHLRVSFQGGGEPSNEIAFNIYRDGVQVATDLDGATTEWTDTDTSAPAESHCYTVEAYFLASGNTSQRAKPYCYWGPSYERIATISAADFAAVGGNYVLNYGRHHYESWGEPSHTLTVSDFNPSFTGPHLLQVVYGNGAGAINTGITCAVKRITVYEQNGPEVGNGFLVMPHLGTWDVWQDSNFVEVDLDSAKTYEIVISHDDRTINMSDLAHNALYTVGNGGALGPYHYVNIAELKVLSRTANP